MKLCRAMNEKEFELLKSGEKITYIGNNDKDHSTSSGICFLSNPVRNLISKRHNYAYSDERRGEISTEKWKDLRREADTHDVVLFEELLDRADELTSSEGEIYIGAEKKKYHYEKSSTGYASGFQSTDVDFSSDDGNEITLYEEPAEFDFFDDYEDVFFNFLHVGSNIVVEFETTVDSTPQRGIGVYKDSLKEEFYLDEYDKSTLLPKRYRRYDLENNKWGEWEDFPGTDVKKDSEHDDNAITLVKLRELGEHHLGNASLEDK